MIRACSWQNSVATPESFASYFHGRQSCLAKMPFLALPFLSFPGEHASEPSQGLDPLDPLLSTLKKAPPST